jgi:hypothetical protein
MLPKKKDRQKEERKEKIHTEVKRNMKIYTYKKIWEGCILQNNSVKEEIHKDDRNDLVSSAD